MTDQIPVTFNGGPKHGERVTFTIPGDRGAPDRITILAVDPDHKDGTVTREGYYERSPLAPALYLWDRWADESKPTKET